MNSRSRAGTAELQPSSLNYACPLSLAANPPLCHTHTHTHIKFGRGSHILCGWVFKVKWGTDHRIMTQDTVLLCYFSHKITIFLLSTFILPTTGQFQFYDLILMESMILIIKPLELRLSGIFETLCPCVWISRMLDAIVLTPWVDRILMPRSEHSPKGRHRRLH